MFKILTPIFALLISIGLVVTYVRPVISDIKATEEESKNYKEAIAKASDLQALLAEKMAERDSFNPVDLDRLETMLPDSVQIVSLIIDLDALAEAHHMLLSGIGAVESKPVASGSSDSSHASQTSSAPTAQAATQGGETPQTHLTYTTLTFTVTGTYEDFRSFIDSMEQSLVFLDVTSLEFGQSDGDLMDFNFTIRTYAYNQGT